VHTPAISSSRWSRSALALVFAVAVNAPCAAGAQTDDLPAATASPGDPDAPNGGEWFSATAEPGETIDLTAQVQNPAEVPQAVRLYLTDLGFDDDRPRVGDPGVGVGAWGGFDEPELQLPAHAVVPAPFTVTVPEDAEPGDHIGAVVVESAPTASGAVQVVKRVAARLYVTVPGDADASIGVESVTADVDSAVLPRSATVRAVIRNTGAVSLDATVTVNGREVDGPDSIVSHSAERFVAEVPLSITGGHKTFEVVVRTRTSTGDGPTGRAATAVWIVPWWSALALFLVAVGGLAVRELSKRLR
jgi:hypothetical protein